SLTYERKTPRLSPGRLMSDWRGLLPAHPGVGKVARRGPRAVIGVFLQRAAADVEAKAEFDGVAFVIGAGAAIAVGIRVAEGDRHVVGELIGAADREFGDLVISAASVEVGARRARGDGEVRHEEVAAAEADRGAVVIAVEISVRERAVEREIAQRGTRFSAEHCGAIAVIVQDADIAAEIPTAHVVRGVYC